MKNPQLKKLQKLLAANNLQGAENLCRKALARNRNDVMMISLLGAVLLKSGRLDEADRHLRRAIELGPKLAKPHEDLAVLRLRRNDFEQAELLFRRATELQPNLRSAWMGLAHALRELGRFTEARIICERMLVLNPDDLNAVRSIAIICTQEGEVSEADRLFTHIAGKAPNSVQALSDLARFHADQHHYPQAIEWFRRAAGLQPRDPGIHFSLASCLLTTGFSAESLDGFDAGLALAPNSPRGRLGRSHALRTLGRTKEVIEEYKACIGKGINAGECWWSLASLRTYRFSDSDIDAMRVLRESDDASERLFVDFALGKAMDDREQYDAAWDHYKSANHARRQQVDYDDARFESCIDAIMECVDSELIRKATASIDLSATPIFILGMPRSGSTLIEQILASHSMVEATTELPYMTALGERNLLPDTASTDPAIVDLELDQLKEIGDSYMRAVQAHRLTGSACFIDKMPDNFQFAGLIAMSLPGARIIDARRNPMDTCVGNFRQWFGNGKEYSYDLKELANRYIQYCRIMQHWDEVMPGKILRVDYENMVADAEHETRRLLNWCELPWEEDCLRFYQSDRVISTASSEQVRQPIYKGAVGFWKNYETYLDELTFLLR